MTKQYGIMPCCGAPLTYPIKHLSTCNGSSNMIIDQIMAGLMDRMVEDMENMSEKEIDELCREIGMDPDKMVNDAKSIIKKALDEVDKEKNNGT